MIITHKNVSFGKAAMEYKEDIRQALNGRIRYDDEYSEPADKETCDKRILECFDNIAMQCLDAYASARALEILAENHKINVCSKEILTEYIRYIEEEKNKYNDYIPEKIPE